MHCWKTINLEKNIGYDRVFLMSFFIMMIVFSVIYVPVNLLFSQNLYDNHFILFIIGIVSLYPLHKLFHFLPILSYLKHVKYTWRRRLGFIPLFSICVHIPIPKYRFITALIFPFVVINSLLLLGCAYFPHYAHYFTILLAYHSGICATDFIYTKYLLTSPRHAMIEENDEGYEILITQ